MKLASDGLPARVNGEWAKRKLEFLDQFGPPALDATERKRRRVYCDLFAGPGMNLPKEDGGEEFESGALRMLTMRGHHESRPAFTDAYLINLDPADHHALVQRIDQLESNGLLALPRGRIRVIEGDAHDALPGILSACHALDYVLVFADPENPSQWPWSMVETLTSRGHKSIDLYLLYPLEMGVRRLLNFRGGPHQDERLTEFFGSEDWRPVVGKRVTEARSKELTRALEELYLTQLRRHWNHANKVMDVRRVGNQGLYRMVFASNHDAGERIATWARRKTKNDDQGQFFP